MLDPVLVREQLEVVKAAYAARNYPLNFLNDYVAADSEWRHLLIKVENLKAARKQAAPKGKPTDEEMAKLKEMADEIKSVEDGLAELEQKKADAALMLPNIVLREVPVGKSEDDNVEVRTWGTPSSPNFAPKPHDELATLLNMVDFERGAKVTGARFSIYTGFGARLERALINFMLDHHGKRGYREMMPPAVVHANSLRGTGQLPKFEADLFKLRDSEWYLSPTAEVQLTNFYQNEILPEAILPHKMMAYTPCFRAEAGSYGKDVKGLIRQHQFNKVELVQLCHPDQSNENLETLLRDAESILQALELPYRVVMLCSGDVGFSSAKTYDIEVWFPSQNKFREISSCSNFLDFQARRAMIRYKDSKTEKPAFLHTINGSGLAVGRTFAAILENYQTSSGTIKIPTVLQSYLGVDEIN